VGGGGGGGGVVMLMPGEARRAEVTLISTLRISSSFFGAE